jgi:hypothetical protein
MRKIFVGLFSVILLQSARAGEGACPSFAVPQDVVDCVLKNHPDILRVQAEVSNLDAFSTFPSAARCCGHSRVLHSVINT